eukprot:scaffold16383_cov59-Phaeocystis_antarctica.AAC.4
MRRESFARSSAEAAASSAAESEAAASVRRLQEMLERESEQRRNAESVASTLQQQLASSSSAAEGAEALRVAAGREHASQTARQAALEQQTEQLRLQMESVMREVGAMQATPGAATDAEPAAAAAAAAAEPPPRGWGAMRHEMQRMLSAMNELVDDQTPPAAVAAELMTPPPVPRGGGGEVPVRDRDEGGWLDSSVLRPLLSAAKRAEAPLSELSEQVVKVREEVGEGMSKAGNELGSKLLSRLACSPRYEGAGRGGQQKLGQTPGLGGLLARSGEFLASAVEDQVTNAKELASEVRISASEAASKVEGAAAEFLGKGQRWVPLPPPAGLARPGQPSPGGRACCSGVLHGERLFVFGGLGRHGLSAQLWGCDLAAGVWEALEAGGEAPTPRAAHSAIVHADGMFVFGGHGRDTYGGPAMLGDLHRLDLRRLKWVRLEGAAELPRARCSHAAVCCRGAMYLFGGEGLQAAPNDSIAIDNDSSDGSASPACAATPRFHMLKELHMLPLQPGGTWRKLRPVSGPTPCGRSGAAAAASPSGQRFFVFGGWDERKHELNDLWQYSISSGLWSELASLGPLGRLPSPRTCASLVAMPDRLVLFGGCDARQSFNGLFEYRLRNAGGNGHVLDADEAPGGWAPLDMFGPAPPPRSSHMALMRAERVYVFGGFDGTTFLSDLHCGVLEATVAHEASS